MSSSTSSPTIHAPASVAGRLTNTIAGPLSGVLAAATAVAVGSLVAVPISPTASPIVAVGAVLIDLAPQAVKAFAIDTFGESDKTALLLGIAAALVVVAGLVGAVSRIRVAIGVVAIAALGAAAAAAALLRPTAEPLDVLPALVGAAAGIAVLAGLIGTAGNAPSADAAAGPATDHSRRRFVIGAAAVAVLSGLTGGLSVVLNAARASVVRSVALPVPTDPAPAQPAGSQVQIDGLSPFVTPNDAFYRVDTALTIPVVDPDGWRLRVHGMVERDTELSLADLLELPTIERDITLTCVSNVVGGPYVGNARWIGVPLRTVLDIAGVQAGVDQIVSRSVDGMTIGTPTDVALDGRDAMLAVAMNGEPLPPAHGFPVRMLVPGLYGYVSATKWLVELELTTFDAYDPYWVQRGWARLGPIKPMSRIDTPRALATAPAGTITIAGVAWAQGVGVAGVEVRIDDGAWVAARLADVATVDTWRQWSLDWPAATGRHRIETRAITADRVIQTDVRAEPFPDGASGWHSIVMTVA